MPKKLLPALLIIGLLLSYYASPTYSAVTSCSASVEPTNVQPNKVYELNFTISNPNNDVRWVKITRPSSNFVLQTTYPDENWDISSTSDSFTYADGYIATGSTGYTFTITVLTGQNQIPAEEWTVQATGFSDGSLPVACTGSLGVAISNGGAASTSTYPLTTSLSVSNIGSTSVSMGWSTDKNTTAKIEYGKTTGYGLSLNDASFTKAHSLNISGLQQNTTYHFRIKNTDNLDQTTISGDNTFTTLKSKASTSPSTIVVFKENTLPKIAVTTKLKRVYKVAPTIRGVATDNVAVVSIDYSLDGGKNWLPVNKVSGIGTGKASFSFKPEIVDDGNYLVRTRSTDPSGNIGYSKKQTLVIDRLPPITGPSIVSAGAVVLQPNTDGALTTITGMDHKIALPAIGGATQVAITASKEDEKEQTKLFALRPMKGSNLWVGDLTFDQPGTYQLKVDSVDGAGRRFARNLQNVSVFSPGTLTDRSSKKPVNKSSVTVYYLEPDSNSWTVWDGKSFGQNNPQATDSEGHFKFLLPPGKYYLEVKAKGYRTLVSDIFSFSKAQVVVADFALKPAWRLGPFIFSWLLPTTGKVEVNLPIKTDQTKIAPLIGKNLPSFELLTTSGRQLNQTGLLGKPTVLSFVGTWSPSSIEQLPALMQLASGEVNFIPVVPLESLGKVKVFNSLAGYNLDFLTDSDSSLTSKLEVAALPTHYFVSRRGVIKKVVVGVLSKKEILDNLSGL